MDRPVFISYSSKDKPIVEKIVGHLSAMNISLWFDKWEIKVGDSIARKINEGIKQSGYLLLILSSNSIKSP
jgi:TIR domain